ncbi:hypothetical protein FIU97_12535 [Roseivivax sp. THAF40]|uniref:hypothetical protein n=1 Tax=Roseivivax sp. THAF40 TaxID=2587858 RepID=UPI0012689446|nr:hypothetical protein [Roseivivax sp. THAF40]QFT47405.1 hypothetical protein FIU97_12535 [Roseivivax sp. THAF40]
MERLAYRFDEEELAQVIDGWPVGVSAVLCMSSSGLTRIALYRSRAPEEVLARIEGATGWSSETFAISPKLPGVRTMRVTFSEAQGFLRMVERVDGLLAMANNFALSDVRPPSHRSERNAAQEVRENPKVISQEQPAIRPWQPRISLSSPDIEMPLGFRSVGEFTGGPIAFLPAEIRTSGARVRILIQPKAVDARDLPVRAHTVGHRDDLRCFLLGPECLREWRPGRGMVVDAKMDAFPSVLVDRFRRGTHAAEVSIAPEGLFVTPLDQTDDTSDWEQGEASPEPKQRWVAMRFGFATLLVAGLVSGGVTALQSAVPAHAVSLAYQSDEGNPAFNVVRSFAASMTRPQAE